MIKIPRKSCLDTMTNVSKDDQRCNGEKKKKLMIKNFNNLWTDFGSNRFN